jgi:hypothetical protein
MRLRGFFLRKATLEHVLVFGQFGAKEPPLRHPFPDSLCVGVIRHFGHLFAVGRVLPKFRWGVHAELRLKFFNRVMAGLVPQSTMGNVEQIYFVQRNLVQPRGVESRHDNARRAGTQGDRIHRGRSAASKAEETLKLAPKLAPNSPAQSKRQHDTTIIKRHRRLLHQCRWVLHCPQRVRPMRLVVLASALILITATSALAQGSPSREAPVGHRQPKAGEVPQEQQQQISDPNKKIKELDDALAKKLNGICRGC